MPISLFTKVSRLVKVTVFFSLFSLLHQILIDLIILFVSSYLIPCRTENAASETLLELLAVLVN